MLSLVKLCLAYFGSPDFDATSSKVFKKLFFIPDEQLLDDTYESTPLGNDEEQNVDDSPRDDCGQQARLACKTHSAMLTRHFGPAHVRRTRSYAIEASDDKFSLAEDALPGLFSLDAMSGRDDRAFLHLLESQDFPCDCQIHRQREYEHAYGPLLDLKTRIEGARRIAAYQRAKTCARLTARSPRIPSKSRPWSCTSTTVTSFSPSEDEEEHGRLLRSPASCDLVTMGRDAEASIIYDSPQTLSSFDSTSCPGLSSRNSSTSSDASMIRTPRSPTTSRILNPSASKSEIVPVTVHATILEAKQNMGLGLWLPRI